MLTLQPLLLAGHHTIRWGHVDGVLDVLQAQQLSAVWTEVVLMLGGPVAADSHAVMRWERGNTWQGLNRL